MTAHGWCSHADYCKEQPVLDLQQEQEIDLASAQVDFGQAATAIAAGSVFPSRGAQADTHDRVPSDGSGIAATALGCLGLFSVKSSDLMQSVANLTCCNQTMCTRLGRSDMIKCRVGS